MADIVVVGSANVDLVANVSKMPRKGETVIGSDFNQITGGKGANQAVAIARLGGKVAMIGKVGNDDFGHKLISGMKLDHINTKFIGKIDGVPTGVALITVDEKGENSIIVIPGANYQVLEEDIEGAKGLIENSHVVMTQLEIPMDTVRYTLKISKGKGKYTILNPAPAQIIDREIIENVDLLTPNETELEILSGVTIKEEEDIKRAVDKLISFGVKELIITLGEKGSIYANDTTFKKYPSYKVTPVDTTGAGDSFNAAIAVGLSQGKSIDEVIDFASKVGALTVTKRGAQSSLPYLEEVLNFKGLIKGI